jgi:hypothetical protein
MATESTGNTEYSTNVSVDSVANDLFTREISLKELLIN